ncbi:MAG: CHAT domain-containing protein, partial [bacterium]
GLTAEGWAGVFSLVVRTHGSVLDWQAELHRLIAASRRTPGTEEERLAVDSATQELADLVVEGPANDTTMYFERLARARWAVEKAERALSSLTDEGLMTSDFVSLHRTISTQSLAHALPPGVTLVQFFTFLRIVDSPSHTPGWRLPHYAAFRLSKPASDAYDLDFVDLGPVTLVDSLIAGYRSAIDCVAPGRRPSAREEAEYRQSARALYDRLWAPVFSDMRPPTGRQESSTQSDRTAPSGAPGAGTPNNTAPLVLIIPDAQLHQIDFNTLLAPGGKLVIERWKTHLLSSGADLLKSSHPRHSGSDMLAAGNPDRNGAAPLILTPDGSGMGASGQLLCLDTAAVAIPLPGAEQEIATVAALYASETSAATTVLSGIDATETQIKQAMPGKRIVHLATHG